MIHHTIYRPSGIYNLMIWVSFFKPMGIFEGGFNRLASWWTAGDYCHCEIVWHVEPVDLMGCVMKLYQQLKNSKSDHKELCAELESVFFENRDNKALLQMGKKVYVSFSLIWGDKLRIRFLQDIEDPWFSTPKQQFKDIQWVQCENISHEKEINCLGWALGEVTKPYNCSAALFSWVPTWGVNDIRPRPSYFCSEFAAMCLVRMSYLKPLATHHCTPNHLEAILRLSKCNTEEETQSTTISQDSEQEEYLNSNGNTPKLSNTTLLEDEVGPSREPNYVSSSDDEISTLEAEMNSHHIGKPPQEEES